MKLLFSVDVRPKAKERPRFAMGHVYTPKKTKDYETLIALSARKAGARPLESPLTIDITATFKRPVKSPSFYCVKRPDVDNLAKAITDGLNGVAYKDDSQIVELKIAKNYGTSDRVDIEIEYL